MESKREVTVTVDVDVDVVDGDADCDITACTHSAAQESWTPTHRRSRNPSPIVESRPRPPQGCEGTAAQAVAMAVGVATPLGNSAAPFPSWV